VVIPCFKVGRHIEKVLRGIPAWVRTIVCVDDCCPHDSSLVIRRVADPRVVLLRHEHNQGVGGAVRTGYEECLRRGADIIVKMDGDDQMDPQYLPALLLPLLEGKADYTKGNRWAAEEWLSQMPVVRRLGNLGLSFAVKAASGYWRVFDPCNGYTAIRATALRRVPLARLARDYFFETSMLVQLNVIGAVVQDVPIPARYGDEKSSLRIGRILCRFPAALLRSLCGRIWRRHFVRDFGPVATFLTCGLLLTVWSILFGGYQWALSIVHGIPATAGTVMLAALPLLMGFQLLLQAAVLEMTQSPDGALCRDEPLEIAQGFHQDARRAA
jgi:glycosyltransferase involved in cell wall biosynthesis